MKYYNGAMHVQINVLRALALTIISTLFAAGDPGCGGVPASSYDSPDSGACGEGEERECHDMIAAAATHVSCLHGYQLCRGGSWSRCGSDGRISTDTVPLPRPTGKTLAGSPTTCVGTTICNPTCKSWADWPTGVLDAGIDSGLVYADAGGVDGSITTATTAPRTFIRDFNAPPCPPGRVLQWGLFTWDTYDPIGTNVTFTFRTAPTQAGLSTAAGGAVRILGVAGYFPLGAGTAADPQVCKGACYRDLGALSPGGLPWLRMEATLNPYGTFSPILKYWNVNYSCPEARPASLAIVPSSVNRQAGETQTLQAVVTMNDGTTYDVTSSTVFTSSNAAVASISGTTLTALTAGAAAVAATDYISRLSATAPVTVTAPLVRNFTNCGAVGRLGPTTCAGHYTSPQSIEVSLSGGIQSWTVPAAGTYRITACGAQGTSGSTTYSGGLGACVRGDFSLAAGTVLRILVGQSGRGAGSGSSGGGGGGSFVVTSTGTILVIGGGGGGTRASVPVNGGPGQVGTAGGSAVYTPGGTGGTGGGGGRISSSWGSGGGGYSGSGTSDPPWGNGGSSFLSGGRGGGVGTTLCGFTADGGFGGGGSGNGCNGGGGGGGYSGGGGGYGAGGGGSFNSGTNQSNSGGVRTGNGSVSVIRL